MAVLKSHFLYTLNVIKSSPKSQYSYCQHPPSTLGGAPVIYCQLLIIRHYENRHDYTA